MCSNTDEVNIYGTNRFFLLFSKLFQSRENRKGNYATYCLCSVLQSQIMAGKEKAKRKKTNLYVQIASLNTKHTAHRKIQEFKKEI